MLVAIAFCNRDIDATKNLLRWMRELDGQHLVHRCALIAPKGMDQARVLEVKREAELSFSNVRCLQTTRFEERKWPIAPNAMFRCFLKWVRLNHKSHFLWHEPDCIPLQPEWLDIYEEEYLSAKKPFMGSIVDKPCRHLTGCAIYPAEPVLYNQSIELGPEDVAWDCVDPVKTVANTHHTERFHHQWFGFNGELVATFPTFEEVNKIRDKALIFHRNKDHTLIDRLRENMDWVKREKVKSFQPTNRNKTYSGKVKRWTQAPTVYSYYEPLNGFDEGKIIDLWRESWERHGWKAILLNDSDLTNQGWKKYVKDMARFPSVNPAGYDLACYKRWAAMAVRVHYKQSALMTDYDVLNYGFTPAMAADATQPDALTFLEERVPSAVIGGYTQFKFACSYMRAYSLIPSDTINGRPHVSDMTMLQKAWNTPWIKHVPVVLQYGNPGWDKALLVHYSNFKTGGHKLEAIAKR